MSYLPKIDYLTLTKIPVRHPTKTQTISRFGAEAIACDVVIDLIGECGKMLVGKPKRFYPFVFTESVTGATVHISDEIMTQGVMLVFSGETLARIEDRKFLLERAMLQGWKVTRIDLAVDVIGEGLTVEEVASEYEKANGANKKRTWSRFHSPTGETLYIGSRKSARMMRLYDKGMQQKSSLDWKRFEIEYKEYAAPIAAERFLLDERFIFSEVLDMLKTPDTNTHANFAELAQGYEPEGIAAPKTVSKRCLWFKTQVMSAFERIVLDDPLEALECLAGIEEVLLDAYTKWMSER